ncbi:Hint domain-containing protein [Halocynthiibacter namhaensis]|uniref:Hint domain-containing protein n=1 Tax=Halocynthiibacter namhaensis TaxID=1290553 RepID=UPI0006913E0A|nr:Hint domain-containing protein [Halocynthiibacter namhaensis]
MAYISELHYSNNHANTQGVSEYVEVVLEAGEDPADFTLSLYQQNGNVGPEFALTNPLIESFPASGGRTVYVIDGGPLNFKITAPTGSGNNYEGIALTDTSGASNVVLDFYDIGSGGRISPNNGAAAGGGSSTQVPTSGSNNSIQIDENGVISYSSTTRGTVCFAAGTQIQVPGGFCNVEDIDVGDPIVTADNGIQQVTWVASRRVNGRRELAPVVIRKGTLGAKSDLYVSPQHRIRISGWQAQLYFGADEVLVPAISLVNGQTILQQPCHEVIYVHFMFDQHEVVISNGVATESFFPGKQAVDMLEENSLNELLNIFPELRNNSQVYGKTIKPVARGSEAGTVALTSRAYEERDPSTIRR